MKIGYFNLDIICILLYVAIGPICLKCDRVRQPYDCANVVTCGDHEVGHFNTCSRYLSILVSNTISISDVRVV